MAASLNLPLSAYQKIANRFLYLSVSESNAIMIDYCGHICARSCHSTDRTSGVGTVSSQNYAEESSCVSGRAYVFAN